MLSNSSSGRSVEEIEADVDELRQRVRAAAVRPRSQQRKTGRTAAEKRRLACEAGPLFEPKRLAEEDLRELQPERYKVLAESTIEELVKLQEQMD